MDVIRRNTDYAMRLVVNLVETYGETAKSARSLSEQEDVSYDLTSKLLQQLGSAGIVKSKMGLRGGFELAKEPGQISMLDIVAVIQGPVIMNSCLDADKICPRQPKCAVSRELSKLQKYVEDYLSNITLDKLLERGCGNCDGK